MTTYRVILPRFGAALHYTFYDIKPAARFAARAGGYVQIRHARPVSPIAAGATYTKS